MVAGVGGRPGGGKSRFSVLSVVMEMVLSVSDMVSSLSLCCLTKCGWWRW